jgi:hypothetical protein
MNAEWSGRVELIQLCFPFPASVSSLFSMTL